MDSRSPIHEIFESLRTEGDRAPKSDSNWSQGIRLEALANLAHELRTPIQVLLGYLDILREEWAPEPGSQPCEILNRMNVNIHDLAQTIDNMIDFALAEVNAEARVDEDITLNSLTADVMPALEAANETKKLRLEFDFANAPEIIRAPRRAIRAIVLNLALNAIKFTESGTITVGLRRIPTKGLAEGFEITISDTGPGVDPKMLDRAAQPFAQLSGSSVRRYRGLGLGLAVVKRNVAALQGKLELSETSESGSTFVVRIPGRVREPIARHIRTRALRDAPLHNFTIKRKPAAPTSE